jgi:ParD-like antitoxin of type II ParDE toxin-antitoxin system
MSQPVKLSDSLVLDARLAGEVVERSIAGQVEFWAKLGRAVDQLLQAPQVIALCRTASVRPLSACLSSVDSPEGRQRVTDFLQSQAFPHYEADPKKPGLLVKIDSDGRRTSGRFVNRRFRAVRSTASGQRTSSKRR